MKTKIIFDATCPECNQIVKPFDYTHSHIFSPYKVWYDHDPNAYHQLITSIYYNDGLSLIMMLPDFIKLDKERIDKLIILK